VRELEITCDDAYRAYPHEAYAYAVQASVMKEFKAKAAGAAQP
jgi:hypothetical protein